MKAGESLPDQGGRGSSVQARKSGSEAQNRRDDAPRGGCERKSRSITGSTLRLSAHRRPSQRKSDDSDFAPRMSFPRMPMASRGNGAWLFAS
jgi:hypothetical protein